MSRGVVSSRSVAGLAVLALAGSALTGCTTDSDASGSADGSGASAQGGNRGTNVAESAPKPTFSMNLGQSANAVPVDKVVRVDVTDGRLTKVALTSPQGRVKGGIAEDGASWTAKERLEPGTTYAVKAVAEGADGKTTRQRSKFDTVDLTLDQQTYPSVAPLDGETVGVGMPVIVNFDVPVTDRASFEKHMSVTSSPAQVGSWHWMSDNEAHWRPKKYWRSGTEVSVDVDINGVPAGGGIYGQEDREVDFTVGDANIYRVDIRSHQMKVRSNGKLLRTIPITTGKPGFDTRSGTKVIIEKFASKRMNSETVGIPQGSSESYDIDNVQWAMRLTYSGEFLHAAPWSVGSQGYANVSHGCTGMSPSDAGWLYSMSKRGDVVEYTGNDRAMEPGNGYADWNTPWQDYRQGSAL